MQIDILILASGEIQLNVDGDLDFATASTLTLAFLDRLTQLGIPITLTRVPEQHKADGGSHAHIVQEGNYRVAE